MIIYINTQIRTMYNFSSACWEMQMSFAAMEPTHQCYNSSVSVIQAMFSSTFGGCLSNSRKCNAQPPSPMVPEATCTQDWSLEPNATVVTRSRHPMPATVTATWSVQERGAPSVGAPAGSPSTAWSWLRNLSGAVSFGPFSLHKKMFYNGLMKELFFKVLRIPKLVKAFTLECIAAKLNGVKVSG